MTHRPAIAFAMAPEFLPDLFPARAMARLDRATQVLSPDPIREFPTGWDLLGETEVLVTGWGAPTLDPDLLNRAPRLRAVVHCAGTIKRLVTEEAWDRGIQVTTAAWVNAHPVAEYTLAAILAAGKSLRAIEESFRQVRADWTADHLPGGMGNYRRVVGIIGASKVGRQLLEMLRAHDFEVLLTDVYLSAEEARELGASKVELDELCARSSIVSLHAPALPSTYRMIDAERLALMPDGATFINTARGSLVDTAALEAELVSGRLNAVLDVTDPEPLPSSSPLYALPNVMLTPHVAGSVGNELERIGCAAIAEIERFAAGEPFRQRVEQGLLARQA
ncbi:MAG: hydroxyacid dehydrogenase [Propioniciclava sp.]